MLPYLQRPYIVVACIMGSIIIVFHFLLNHDLCDLHSTFLTNPSLWVNQPDDGVGELKNRCVYKLTQIQENGRFLTAHADQEGFANGIPNCRCVDRVFVTHIC